jgi:hypothetical protein
MSDFNVQWDWLPVPPAEDAFGPERSTWAKLRLDFDTTCITSHVAPDGSAAVKEVVGPLSGIADWLVENWLFLSWESHTPFPKTVGERASHVPSLKDARNGEIGDIDISALARWLHRHTLGHGDSDLALPAISFLPEERVIGISVAAPSYHLKPTISFGVQWPREPIWIPRDELLADLRSIVVETIERARVQPETKDWAEWMAGRFKDAESQAASPERRRELLFGKFVAAQWDKTMAPLGKDAAALVGVLTDSPIIEEERSVSFVADAVRDGLRVQGLKPAWYEIQPDPGEKLLPPYERGYRLARRVRSFLKEPTKPLLDLAGVISQMGIRVAPVSGPPLFRSASVVGHEGQSTVMYLANHPQYSGLLPTRFGIAAALGRLVAEGSANTAFGAAVGAQSRVQATQQANAFAAEFLLPYEALEGSGADVATLSEEYGISRKAAEKHRENRLRQN